MHPLLSVDVPFVKKGEIKVFKTLRKGESKWYTYKYCSFNNKCMEYWLIPRELKSRLDNNDTETKKLIQFAIYLKYRGKGMNEKEAREMMSIHCEPMIPMDTEWKLQNSMHTFDFHLKSIQLPAYHFDLKGIARFLKKKQK